MQIRDGEPDFIRIEGYDDYSIDMKRTSKLRKEIRQKENPNLFIIAHVLEFQDRYEAEVEGKSYTLYKNKITDDDVNDK